MEPLTLAAALTKVEKVIIWKESKHPRQSDLSPQQANLFFSALQQKTELKTLLIRTWNIVLVDPEVLANALNNLEEITILHDMITEQQAMQLFIRMSEKSYLQKFTIMNINLSTVEPKSLAKGVSKMRELKMFNCNFTSSQIIAIFSQLQESKTLIKLNFGMNDLSVLESKIVAKLVNNVMKMTIQDNVLSFEHTRCIFKQCAEETKLKYFDVRNTDISHIEPKLLAKAFNNIEEVRINGCFLTKDQLNRILKDYLNEEESKMKNIYFVNENMNAVQDEIMAKLNEKFSI